MMQNKITLSGKLIATTIFLALIFLALYGTLDSKGEYYTNDAFERSLVTFGIARGLNGVISVAQGTEVALHPAGLGVNFAPGQVLDPINDLVEQFSWVMLAASASLGIQKIFLSISATEVVSGFLVVLLSLYCISIWWPKLFSLTTRKLILSAVIIILFLRFSVPLSTIGSELLYEQFLQQQYTESTEKLGNTVETISKISNEEEPTQFKTDEGALDKVKRLFNSATDNLSLKDKLEKYKTSAAEATTYVINLIVVFTIQTIIFPLFFLWTIYRSMKLIWSKLLAT